MSYTKKEPKDWSAEDFADYFVDAVLFNAAQHANQYEADTTAFLPLHHTHDVDRDDVITQVAYALSDRVDSEEFQGCVVLDGLNLAEARIRSMTEVDPTPIYQKRRFREVWDSATNKNVDASQHPIGDNQKVISWAQYNLLQLKGNYIKFSDLTVEGPK